MRGVKQRWAPAFNPFIISKSSSGYCGATITLADKTVPLIIVLGYEIHSIKSSQSTNTDSIIVTLIYMFNCIFFGSMCWILNHLLVEMLADISGGLGHEAIIKLAINMFLYF